MSKAQGETVSIVYDGQPASSTPTPMLLKSANGLTRVLQSYEQLIVDSLIYDLDDNVVNGNGAITVFAGPNADDSPGSVIVALFGSSYQDTNGSPTPFGTGEVQFKHEGMALPVGQTPKILVATNGAMTFHFFGTGRIVVATQSPGRQSWQSKLNP